MNILFIGNMGGTKNTPHPIVIDRDNIEEVLSQLQVNIPLKQASEGSEDFYIPITEMDDFHPDQIYQSHEVFERLRQLRRQINNKNTYQAAVEKIQSWTSPINETNKEDIVEKAPSTDNANLLDSILGSAPSRTANSQSSTSLVDQLIKEVVSPYIIEADDPSKESYLNALDKALTDQMRHILHDDNFQTIESSWRDLLFLVRHVETSSKLKLYLLDSDKDNCSEKLNEANAANPEISWNLILAHYPFSASDADINLLSHLGSIGEKLDTPFFANADANFLGLNQLPDNDSAEEWPLLLDEKLEAQWSKLRSSPMANYLYLTLPRVLYRYPYGKKSSPVDSFAFEELESPPTHQHYAWGNSATLIIYMIVQAYLTNSQQMNPNQFNRIGNLAHHYFDEEGEQVMKPCAEIELTSRGGEIIANKGIIPIFSIRNEDAVQVGNLGSIAMDRNTHSIRG